MYEYLQGDNNKGMRVIGTQNGTAFSVKYAAEPGSYDEYLPTAQRRIDSLTISRLIVLVIFHKMVIFL
jgi:hypothetical protein